MYKQALLISWLLICFSSMLLPLSVFAQDQRPQALLLTAEGAVTPVMAEYISRGIERAENQGMQLVVIQLDTPGGNVEVMNRIVKDMRASPVPVVVYVAPRGAIAGSAGTVITLAGHAAAMAPNTAIGAASPVGPEGQDLGETLEEKTKNILKATVRSLAEGRGLEALTMAQDTIETAEAASAREALEAGLIDFIAEDMEDLLEQLDGVTVLAADGEITMQTSGAAVTEFQPTYIEQVLSILTNPNIVFLLLAIGVQAVLIEISNPGGWVAGFIGVVCLALATYGLGVLPVNWFGLIFIITAFVLFILDIKAPTHGALTAAGVISLIVGALVLFNSPSVPSFQRVSVPLIVGVSAATGAVFFAILLFALRAQATPVLMGQESLVGRVGLARAGLAPTGMVQMGGEQWSAELVEGEPMVGPGTKVEVVRVEGLKLFVKKAGDKG